MITWNSQGQHSYQTFAFLVMPIAVCTSYGTILNLIEAAIFCQWLTRLTGLFTGQILRTLIHVQASSK